MSKNLAQNIFIAGGGTGGHIYPGVAIARAIQEKNPNMQIHFIGAVSGLEEKIVPREGFPLHLIQVGKLHSSVGKLTQFKTLLGLPWAVFRCMKLLRQLKPVAVLGVGGYASGPMLLAACLKGYPTAIWEPNAHPGMTNRWLSKWVDQTFVVFEAAEKEMKSLQVRRTGLPVRKEVEAIPQRQHQIMEPFKILIFGGSQGARAINTCVAQAIEKGGAWLKRVEIIHQTGPLDYDKINNIYQNLHYSNIQVFQYLHDMPERLRWADLLICRAGASTVAEVAAAGKAAIFIPLPTAADDHQRKNAEVLIQANAAEMILQKDLTPESLISCIEGLLNSPQNILEYEEKVREFHQAKAGNQIAELLLQDMA